VRPGVIVSRSTALALLGRHSRYKQLTQHHAHNPFKAIPHMLTRFNQFSKV